jgi:F-type H+-transporting ATPase subunit epsilon
MKSTFPVAVRTVEDTVVQMSADFVRAPGTEGDLGILAHHMPFLTPLRLGEVIISSGRDETFIFVAGGFLTVFADRVVILADVAERADAIDVDRAEQARRRAEDALARDRTSADAAQARERALLRIKIAEIPRKRHPRPSGMAAK